MRTFTPKIIAIVAVFFSHSALPQWTKIAETNQAVHYFDEKSVRNNGGVYEVWWLMNLKAPIIQQVGFASVVGYEQINCKNRQTFNLTKTTYTELFGAGIGNPNRVSNNWEPVQPGGLTSNLMREVCLR